MSKMVNTLLATLYTAAAGLFLLAAPFAQAQVVVVPPTPQIGSSNPATPEPPVPRPPTQPCTVTLFQNVAFDNFTPYVFNYTPPSDCPGPWAKVVFTGDFTVTAGRQFDRTAAFYLGHANVYYGTTAEPRSTLSPSWHVERDVTDLTAIFKTEQSGQADLGNFVGVSGGVTYNGIIYVTAKLEFYPASWTHPAPRTPDIVIPVNGPGGDAGTLNTAADQITHQLSLPRNVERAYLDVVAQSQSSDEFWYFCVPTNEASNLLSCGNTSFRETEVYLDGQPAGVAPVSPWIYTGGIDPYLWEPLPGVQTLDFKPYRVDLTPFASVLSDGQTHTVAVSVFNANSYFLATANLLVYTDPWREEVKGKLLGNTLTIAPAPVITDNITQNGSTYTGTITVGSNRNFKISGYVDTSHGRVETTVEQTVDFLSKQDFNVSPTKDIQNVVQTSTVHSRTTTRDGFIRLETKTDYSFPLTLDYSFVENPDNSSSQTVEANQTNTISQVELFRGFPIAKSSITEQVQTQDTLNFTPDGALSGTPIGSATATNSEKTSSGHCSSNTLTAANRVLTSAKEDTNCPSK